MRPVANRHVYGGGDDSNQRGILLIPIRGRGSGRTSSATTGSRLRRGFGGGFGRCGGFGCAVGRLLREEGTHGRGQGRENTQHDDHEEETDEDDTACAGINFRTIGKLRQYCY